MKIGIIIIFFNNEKDINISLFNELFNLKKHTQLCLVNNGSSDGTLEKLQEFKLTYESNINILDVKRNKGDEAAIKAGARYLFNQNEIKHIGYLNVEKCNSVQDLKTLLMALLNHKEDIIQYNLKTLGRHLGQRTLIKNIFSVIDYFTHLKIKFKENHLKPASSNS